MKPVFAEMAFSIVARVVWNLHTRYKLVPGENLKQVFTSFHFTGSGSICISVCLVVARGLCVVGLPDLNPMVAARARQRVKRVSREVKGLNRNAALISVDVQEPLLDVGDRSERIPRKVQVSLTPGLSGQNHSFRGVRQVSRVRWATCRFQTGSDNVKGFKS